MAVVERFAYVVQSIRLPSVFSWNEEVGVEPRLIGSFWQNKRLRLELLAEYP